MRGSLWPDLTLAIRSLGRSPGFTAAAVVTLALGIGANTAVFSIVDGVLLNPVPFPDPDRLVVIYAANPNNVKNALSYPNFEDLRRDTRVFDGFAAWRTHAFTLTGLGDPQALYGKMVSAELFDVLRVQPVAGRAFRPDEDRLGATPVAMIGEDFWRSRFDADATILGRSLVLDGRTHTVVGIAPSAVRLTRAEGSFLNDVYVPLGQYDDPLYRRRGASNGTVGLARLRSDTSLAQARTAVGVVAARLEREYPEDNRGVGVNLLPLADDSSAELLPALVALVGAAGLVLLIACGNIGNLMLARSFDRRHETAIRVALGAARRQVLAPFLGEALVLSAAGGALGVVLAPALTRTFLSLLPDALPAMTQVGVNLRVLGFAFVASGFATLVLGVLTGLRALKGAHTELTVGARSVRVAGATWQRGLVVAQLALTLVLLVGTGLLTQSLVQVLAVDPGLDPTGVLRFRTALSAQRTTTPTAVRAAFRELEDRLAQIPGVTAAGIDIGSPPFEGGSTSVGFWRADQPPPAKTSDGYEAIFHAVGPHHFRATGTPLLNGRVFSPFDDERAARVLIVDDTLARTVFPGENAVGRQIRFGGFDGAYEIVGVVGHVRHWGLDRDDAARVRAQMYLPYAQLPDILAPLAAGAIGGVVRSTEPAASVVNAVRREVARFDQGQAIRGERTMTAIIDASLAERRFSLTLFTAFALLALTIAVVGTYGLVAYLVTQRTPEIGVRMAVGARPVDIVRMVLGDGQRMVVGALLIGLPAAWGFAHVIAGQLYGVAPTDPATFGGVATLLTATTLGACLLAARRAGRIDPLVALRQD